MTAEATAKKKDEIPHTKWETLEKPVRVNIPPSLIILITDRKILRAQTEVSLISIGSNRFQLDQRSKGTTRKIVLQFDSKDDHSVGNVAGCSVMMFKVGEGMEPETLQEAVDRLSQAIVLESSK